MCTELMLIVEVDGITHWHDNVVQKDMIKQDDLEKVGFMVLRFDDNDVLNDIENVERVLLGYIEAFEKVHPPSVKAKRQKNPVN